MPGTEYAPAPAVPRDRSIAAYVRRVAAVGPRLIPLAVAATVFVTFVPALLNRFVEWDDYINLFENRKYRGLGWAQIKWMFSSTLMGHYIPVTWLTFGLDYTLWGMNPFGYHLTNVLIHTGNAVVFYAVARILLERATSLTASALTGGAVFATLLFALHPLRAESVAWATERRDVLSGLFFLLTVLLYLKAVAQEGQPKRRLIAASVACYLLALLSKSIVMTLPAVLLLLDVYPLGRLTVRWKMWADRTARAVIAEKWPYLVLAVAGAATSYWAVATNDFFTPVQRYGWPARIAMTGHSLWFYFAKTVVPTALSPLHELPVEIRFGEPRFLLSGLAVIGMTALTLALRRRWPAGLAVWAYYALVLAPISGLVHAGHQLTHDRYSYLSCLGWALLGGAALGCAARATAEGTVRPLVGRAVAAVAAAWIVAVAALTWYQVQIWRDTETLWHYAVDAEPTCAICQNNLGLAYYKKGEYAFAKARYEQAIALRPDRMRSHGNLGLVLQSLGDYEGAMRHLDLAVKYYPSDPDILTNMGVTLINQRRYAEALPHLERAHRIDPDHVPGLVNLGVALIDTGRADQALPHLLRAWSLKPDEAVTSVNLVRAYRALGQTEAARAEYERLRRLDPRLADSLDRMPPS